MTGLTVAVLLAFAAIGVRRRVRHQPSRQAARALEVGFHVVDLRAAGSHDIGRIVQ